MKFKLNVKQESDGSWTFALEVKRDQGLPVIVKTQLLIDGKEVARDADADR